MAPCHVHVDAVRKRSRLPHLHIMLPEEDRSRGSELLPLRLSPSDDEIVHVFYQCRGAAGRGSPPSLFERPTERGAWQACSAETLGKTACLGRRIHASSCTLTGRNFKPKV